ncbi:WYL domain-containing transcriptional regulator [soil metagenome]
MMRRIVEIHGALKEAPQRKANCSVLAEFLEVDRKTVLRDLWMMRYDFDLPIAYDDKQHTYYYEYPVDHLPLFHPSEGEMLALFVAERALDGLRGTAVEAKVRSALRKIAAAMPEEVSLSLGEMAEGISFRRSGVARMDVEAFATLSKAVQEGREVVFEYKKLGAGRFSVRHVEPYHLAEINGAWYVVGHDLKRRALRTFALARIKGAEVRGRKFVRPAGFSMADHLRDSFGVFGGAVDGKKRKVRVRFDAFAAQLIRERDWHPSQRMQELTGGELELTMTLDSLQEVQRWILSWGRHATVLEPSELKRMVASRSLTSRGRRGTDL